MKDTPNLHNTHTHLGSFGVVKFCSLRGEGRRGWERRVKNGVRMKQMITLENLVFVVIYNYFENIHKRYD